MRSDTCWATHTLGDIADFVNGDRGKNYPTSSDYVYGGIPFVSASDLDGRNVNLSGATFISEEAYDRLGNGKIIEGDILFCLRGSLGKIGLANGISKGAIASSLVIIRPKEGVSLDFLYYILSGSTGKSIARELDNGSVQGNLSVRELKQVEVELPGHKEQEAIAHILGTLDDKIELNRQTNETLETMAKALFKSWFVDFDPVRAKAESRPTGLPDEISDLFPDSFEESELGEIPSGWRVQPVGDVIECVGGSTPSTSESEYWDDGEYFWATPKDLSSLSEPFILDTAKKITEAGVQRISSGVLPAGTVLLSSRAPVGYLAVATVPLSINQGFIALKSNDLASSAYLLNWCLSNVQQFKDRASGTTFPEISKAAFRPIPFLVPSEQIMSAFSAKAQVLYDRVVWNIKQSDCLAKSRDALLPKLISGEIRIPDAERMLEEVGV